MEKSFFQKFLLWLVVVIVASIAYTYGIAPLLMAFTLPHLIVTLILCVMVLAFCWWSLSWFGILK